MASRDERIGYFIDAFTELREQGREWSYLPHVSERAALFDEPYMRRRAAVNRLLKLVGVKREAYPSFYPSPGSMYILASALEEGGVIEGRFEERHDLRYPRRVYRLIPVIADGNIFDSPPDLAE
jgi:hypothetical protein